MEDVKPDTTRLAHHAGALAAGSRGDLRIQCSCSADPVNRTGSIQHLKHFIIHKGTLVLVGCRLEFQSPPESDTHHQGVWVSILSEDQHYLLI